ncbi:MAG: four helix bundle protein [Deltaproteobacteria bacterium]|nr:four helix bundle protein [Deltaproteobacteria bacterium]
MINIARVYENYNTFWEVYRLTKKTRFAKGYGLKRQIQDAAGASMHNIAEGFDSETNGEFMRFL